MLFEKCSPNVHSNNSTSQSQDSDLEGLWGERRSRWKTNVYVDYTLWRTPVTGKTSVFLWMNPTCTLTSDWIQAATSRDSLHAGGLDIFYASVNCTTTSSNAALVLEALETVLCLAKDRMNLQVSAWTYLESNLPWLQRVKPSELRAEVH